MSVQTAELIVAAFAAYMGLGAAFALLFVIFGVGQADHAAKGSGWGFRTLIFPAVTALWPLMLIKWIGALFGGAKA